MHTCKLIFEGIANLEFMCVVSTVYDQNELAYRERSSAHNFAHVGPIETTIVINDRSLR